VRGCVSFNSSGDMWLKRLLARLFAASKFGLHIHTHQILEQVDVFYFIREAPNFGVLRFLSAC
jgi:hypothetical protein